MNSDQANKILAAFDFDDGPSNNHTDSQPVSTDDPNLMNEMMMKLFTAMDPEMLIHTGMALKTMKNGS